MLVEPKISMINQSGSNVYFIEGKNNLMVDTGSFKDLSYLESELNQDFDREILLEDIDLIVNTHCHFDHIAGNKAIHNRGIPLMAHKLDAPYIENANPNYTLYKDFNSSLRPCQVDKKFDNEFKVPGTSYEVIWTPGHTPGSVCLYNPSDGILISGDILFSRGGYGRTDLPGGDKQSLKKSIKELSSLEVDKLLPGHGPPELNQAESSIENSLSNFKES